MLTHELPADWHHEGFHFVTTGIADAVAKARELAGDKILGLNGGEIARQALEAGLLEEVWVDLVPVLLGGGQRLFPEVAGAPVLLEQVAATADEGVTHLRYRIRKER